MRISLMTASLSRGDAIGNYCITLRRLLIQQGHHVQLYADAIDPPLGAICLPTSDYRSTGSGLLWFNYSIGADNLSVISRSTDRLLMDFHGVCPPSLLRDTNPHLAELCQIGTDALPTFRDVFDLAIVHSEYSRKVLNDVGYRIIHKLPLVVDTQRYDGQEDCKLTELLSLLDYWIFVGRIVPQKGIVRMLRLFAAFAADHPTTGFILVGDRTQTPSYQTELDQTVRSLHLDNQVCFTGPVLNPRILTSLYKHATFGVFLSEWETFCVPLVEAMYFGTPVVVGDVPPLAEIAGTGGVVLSNLTSPAPLNALVADRVKYGALRAAATTRAAAFTEAALANAVALLLATDRSTNQLESVSREQ
jgi:L-malate glycosyltransferase